MILSLAKAACALMAMLPPHSVLASQPPIQASEWYVSTGSDESLRLGAHPVGVELKSGWSCTVGKPTASGARETSCRKGPEAFEFTVQCGGPEAAEHTQIRFRDPGGALVDYIEVGCKPGP